MNISSDPLFIDAANGDFRLSLASPSINAANGAVTNLPATDYFGNPRSLFGAPDHGAIEQTDIALDPSMAGNAGAPLLTLNGSSGGASRRVAVGLAQTMTVGIGQPSSSATPARFIVFGAKGVPSYADTVALPFGIGTVSITPCVLAHPSPSNGRSFPRFIAHSLPARGFAQAKRDGVATPFRPHRNRKLIR